jgi:dihydropteroate synthase
MIQIGSASTSTYVVQCRDRELDCRPGNPSGAHVMGILNITPDSFSDGGKYLRPGPAVARAEEMIAEGAAIIDVGGESSRPTGKAYGDGARPITPAEEIRRVTPVIEGITKRFPQVIVSVDTYKPEVASAAMDAGAHIVNDITGLRFSTDVGRVAAEAGAGLIVMHSVGAPGALPHNAEHEDVIGTVRQSLELSLARAHAVGADNIIVDPGFGFGKSAGDNLRLIKSLRLLTDLGRPIMLGISRKSTIGRVLAGEGELPPPERRLFGALGATAHAVLSGASIIRTHDIRETVEMLMLLNAIQHA